jgi:hypothetical protein
MAEVCAESSKAIRAGLLEALEAQPQSAQDAELGALRFHVSLLGFRLALDQLVLSTCLFLLKWQCISPCVYPNIVYQK